MPETAGPSWRRHGLLVAGSGLCLIAAGTAFSLPLMHVGTGIALAGGLYARQPIHRMPGWPLLLLAALWAWTAKTVGWLQGIDGAPLPLPDKSVFCWLVIPITAIVARDPAWRRRILTCIIISLSAGVVLALLQFTIGFHPELRPFRIDPTAAGFERVSGFFSFHLTQSFVTGSILLLLIFTETGGGRLRGAVWGGRLVAIVGLLLTQARSVIASLICGLLTAVAVVGRSRLLLGLGICLALAVSALVSIAVIRPELIEDIGQHQANRRYIWTVATDACLDHPCFGLGGKQPFKNYYQARVEIDHPEVMDTLDPDNPQPMIDRHPEVLEDPRFLPDLQHYQRLGPDQAKKKAWVRGEVIRKFNDLTGRSALFPEGAPHAHSSLLTLAAFFGTPCALAYLVGLVIFTVAAWRRREHDRTAAGLVIGLVVFSQLAGLFEYFAGDSESAYVLMFCLGMAWAKLRGDDGAAEPVEPADDQG